MRPLHIARTAHACVDVDATSQGADTVPDVTAAAQRLEHTTKSKKKLAI
jgi:hypothetical protein